MRLSTTDITAFIFDLSRWLFQLYVWLKYVRTQSFFLSHFPFRSSLEVANCQNVMNLKTPHPYWHYSRGYKRRTQALENKFAAVTSRAVSSECVWPCFQRFPLKHIVREVAGSGRGNNGGGNLQPQRRAAGNLCSLTIDGSGTLLARVAAARLHNAHWCVLNNLRKLKTAAY